MGFSLFTVLELIHIHFHDKESTRRLQFSTPELSLGRRKGGGVAPVQNTIFETRVQWARRKNIGLCMRLNLGELIFGLQKGQFSTCNTRF